MALELRHCLFVFVTAARRLSILLSAQSGHFASKSNVRFRGQSGYHAEVPP